MQTIVIFGGCSAIAEKVARIYAARGAQLFLVDRNEQGLKDMATDLAVRGAGKVDYAVLDLTQTERFDACLEQINGAFGGVIDVALIAHGTLPDQKACEQSVDKTLLEIKINAISTVALLTLLANQFERRRGGTLAAISSVAGDRGRQSNYVYGSAKSMITVFMEGLRNRLAKHDVQVLTIKPGFVDTPMTAGFTKSGPLWAQPEQVAEGIVKAIDGKKDEVYLLWFWRYIMLVIRHIPEFIFKRMSL